MDKVENFTRYKDNYTLGNRMKRLLWNVCWTLFVRPFYLPFFKSWRCFVYRCFGAKIGKGCAIDGSARVWAPWNLEMGQLVAIGRDAIIYNPGKVILGSKVAVSQYAYLCTATHDYESPLHTLYWKPIVIDDFAWVAARSFVAPGVHIGMGAVVGATASVYKDVEPWAVVGGNPAKFLKRRILNNNDKL